jgi:superfamily II DNA/RNA helicase
MFSSFKLGLQIEQVWKKWVHDYKVNVCTGGHSIDTEIKNLSNPPAVLIGTQDVLRIILTEVLLEQIKP